MIEFIRHFFGVCPCGHSHFDILSIIAYGGTFAAGLWVSIKLSWWSFLNLFKRKPDKNS